MDPFARVPLGGTDVTVTRLGMGLAPIGGLYSAVGDRTAAAAVDEAWRRGVRFFDTAPLYGAGLSERRAGAALRDIRHRNMTKPDESGTPERSGSAWSAERTSAPGHESHPGPAWNGQPGPAWNGDEAGSAWDPDRTGTPRHERRNGPVQNADRDRPASGLERGGPARDLRQGLPTRDAEQGRTGHYVERGRSGRDVERGGSGRDVERGGWGWDVGGRGVEGDGFTVATKVGRRVVPDVAEASGMWAEGGGSVAWDFSGDGVRASHRESLERLGLERVDVLHLHDPDEHFEQALHEALPALVAMRREGTIGAVSAGMNQAEMLTEFARTGQFDCFLLAGRYSLLDQSGLATILPECHRRGISVIVGGVYNSGILAAPVPGATYDYQPASPKMLARAQAMERVCARYDVPLRAAALQFPLGHPAVVSVLIGMRSAEEAADAAAMARVAIPGALWRDLAAAWLLDAEVPVP